MVSEKRITVQNTKSATWVRVGNAENAENARLVFLAQKWGFRERVPKRVFLTYFAYIAFLSQYPNPARTLSIFSSKTLCLHSLHSISHSQPHINTFTILEERQHGY